MFPATRPWFCITVAGAQCMKPSTYRCACGRRESVHVAVSVGSQSTDYARCYRCRPEPLRQSNGGRLMYYGDCRFSLATYAHVLLNGLAQLL